HLQRGNFPAARRAHGRCLRAARRHGLRELEGNALHDLFVTAYHAGEHDEAIRFAGQALAAYGPAHRQVPRLAYDLAYNWVLQGHFREALPVAAALLPRFGTAAERLLVRGLICRAAGGAGDGAAFEAACGEVVAAGMGETAPDTYSGALVGVAHGAASLGRWALAEQMATRISAVAQERGEGELVMMADTLLDAARRRQRTDVALQQETAGDTSVAAEFVSALALR
ncbi:MAG TPA: hypothetical protein VFH27_05510, partial [Longimicrobiaceae bacterium]|nr:hypothetical protein [Longimicrobiaceae bacterium]